MSVSPKATLIAMLVWGFACPGAPIVHAAPESAPLSSDRPDETEGPTTVPAGRFQLEAGYTFTREADVREHSLGEMLLRIGAGATTELRVGLNSYKRVTGGGERAAGFEDLSLGVKVNISKGSDGRRPALGVLAETTLPTGASAFRSNHLQPTALLAAEWTLSPRLSLGANVGASYVHEEDESFSQAIGTLSLGMDLSDRTGAYLEVFGFANGSGGGPNRSYINGGATYLVRPDFQVDARVGAGMNGVANDYFFGVGATHRW